MHQTHLVVEDMTDTHIGVQGGARPPERVWLTYYYIHTHTHFTWIIWKLLNELWDLHRHLAFVVGCSVGALILMAKLRGEGSGF